MKAARQAASTILCFVAILTLVGSTGAILLDSMDVHQAKAALSLALAMGFIGLALDGRRR